jgi:DnaJ domain
MPTLIFGVVVLVLILWVLNVISKVDPKVAARVTKVGGGLLALGFAVFLGLRGEIGIAIPLGVFGLGLLGWVPFGPAGFTARTQKSGGQTSRVQSTYFEMELDHDTGAMRGRVLAGRYQGAELENLDVQSLAAMLTDVDDESRALLMAYLDRRDPTWSEHAQSDAATGRPAASSGKMSEQEAYQILGLEPGASADDISRAHRTLMKKLHPDQGGSTYLAARINEAKEILLRRHR